MPDPSPNNPSPLTWPRGMRRHEQCHQVTLLCSGPADKNLLPVLGKAQQAQVRGDRGSRIKAHCALLRLPRVLEVLVWAVRLSDRHDVEAEDTSP